MADRLPCCRSQSCTDLNVQDANATYLSIGLSSVTPKIFFSVVFSACLSVLFCRALFRSWNCFFGTLHNGMKGLSCPWGNLYLLNFRLFLFFLNRRTLRSLKSLSSSINLPGKTRHLAHKAMTTSSIGNTDQIQNHCFLTLRRFRKC